MPARVMLRASRKQPRLVMLASLRSPPFAGRVVVDLQQARPLYRVRYAIDAPLIAGSANLLRDRPDVVLGVEASAGVTTPAATAEREAVVTPTATLRRSEPAGQVAIREDLVDRGDPLNGGRRH